MSTRGKGRALFVDESDEDSIATQSTAESEALEEYGVDRILLEKEDEEGVTNYLIKWEGYPLGRSSWEPANSILDESIIEHWEEEKRRIRRGEAEPFDEDDFLAAVEDIFRAKQDRGRRRKAKRRKRGLPVSSESDKNDGENTDDTGGRSMFVGKRARSPEDEAPVKARKRVPQPEVNRKGVAKRVDRSRRKSTVVAFSSSEDELSLAKSSGGDSLFDEIASTAKPAEKETPTRRSTRARLAAEEAAKSDGDSEDEPTPRKRPERKKPEAPAKTTSAIPASAQGAAKKPSSTTTAPVKDATRQPTSTVPAKDASRKPSSTAAAAAQGAATKTSSTASAQDTVRQSSSTVPTQPVQPPAPAKKTPLAATADATSSAPKAKHTGGPDKVFANWDAEKKGKPKPRVSGATPKDSADPKFRNLSQQHRFQQYSKNEKAPDPNALSMIDPKTGKKKQPASTVEVTSTAVHSAYSRRTPPPPPERPPEPLAPEPIQTPEPAVSAVPASTSHTNPTHPEKWETCYYWTKGTCRYNEDTCRRAHYYTGFGSSDKRFTCYYWKTRGFCSKSDDICLHAHYDTGQIAPMPPSSYAPANANETLMATSERPYQQSDVPLQRAPDVTASDANSTVDVVNKQLTCYYWKTRGHCNKTEEDCLHAHRDTGYVAPRPRDSYTPVDANETPVAIPERPYHHSDVPLPLIANRRASDVNTSNKPIRDVTCYYWRTRGHCSKPDDVCAFAHYDTGTYAGPPGTFRRGQTYSSTLGASANTVPLGNRDYVAPHSARSPDATQSERIDAGWKLQTAGQTARPGSGSPMDLTASPMHMGDASPHEPTQQTPHFNILGAAMQRRPSVPKLSMKAKLALQLQGEAEVERVGVKLDIDDLPAFEKLAGSDPLLRIDQMITSSDFEHLLWQDGLREAACSAGGIFADAAQANSVEAIADVCKTHVAGLVATPDGRDSKMLIYPGNAEEWKFFDREREHSSECVLRFRLFEELPNPPPKEWTTQEAPIDKRPPAQILAEDLVHLDSETIFPEKELKKHPVRAVFLMIPADHQAELAVFKEYFAALKCKVYHSGQAGAWDYFRKKFSSSCALIVHPDVQLWRIPELYAFLASTGGGVRMFSIGVNPTVALLEEREPEFTCDRLFPHGMVIFITDDTFRNDPEQATSIINAFIEAHRPKPPGGETSRIAARPGILEWLLNLVVENTADRGRKDDRWMALYNAMCKLSVLDLKDEDLDDDPELADDPLFLISLSPELLPAMEDLKATGDRDAATDMAVDWFAGWSLLHASSFRKFVVCHEARVGVDEAMNGSVPQTDPRGWGRKYQHMGVVRAKDALQMVAKKKETEKPDRRPPLPPK
ncbi:hypothetical protein PRZ48_003008 [Zasmidium cellare]|uniref:Chromo domain-containing protein n=1 Tax=Zasmidium cellare TaxID=395010 RepID=A0ABR0EUV5_ZASCE|nr:hypothetical protein PRZ48_003008 [Zasmidium cellare]